MAPAIMTDQLSKTFQVKVRAPGLRGALQALFHPRYRDVHAVRQVTFHIDPGEIVAFLGPNGAGKTTTLKMLTGLLYPTSGRVEVAGFAPWSGGAEFKRRIALVLGNRQQLAWDLPPEETFQLNRAIYDIPALDYRERLDELVTLLELGDLLDKPVRQLSLGERMKCELAAALLHQPEVLFLDEPTLGLDPDVSIRIRAQIAELRRERGTTIILTTHYMREAEELCDTIAFIKGGRILAEGSADALKRQIRIGDVIVLRLDPPFPERIGELPGILQLHVRGERVECTVDAADKRLPEILRWLVEQGVLVRECQVKEPDLEEVFVELAR